MRFHTVTGIDIACGAGVFRVLHPRTGEAGYADSCWWELWLDGFLARSERAPASADD